VRSDDEIQYAEPFFPDEYAARKGTVPEPEAFCDENTVLRCGNIEVQRHLFAGIMQYAQNKPVVETIECTDSPVASPETFCMQHLYTRGKYYLMFSTSYMNNYWLFLL